MATPYSDRRHQDIIILSMIDRFTEMVDRLSAREVEEIKAIAERRLRQCSMCNGDGAFRYRVARSDGKGKGTRASLLLCPACFDKHRLPDHQVDGDG